MSRNFKSRVVEEWRTRSRSDREDQPTRYIFAIRMAEDAPPKIKGEDTLIVVMSWLLADLSEYPE